MTDFTEKWVSSQDFMDVKTGDTVTRLMAECVVMPLVVSSVDSEFIHCGGLDGWKFDRKTGFEVDEELGLGPQFGVIGSRLLKDGPEE